MLCVTLTLANSVSSASAGPVVEQLVSSLRQHPDAVGGPVAEFQVITPRQVQGCLASADEAVGFILSAARSDVWGVHLTLISDSPGELSTEEHLAELESALREAAISGAQALRAPGSVRVVVAQSGELLDAKAAPEVGPIESALQLLSAIERRRSDEGQEAGLMINSGRSQTQAAKHLGVTQQAISSRLQAGYWYESRKVAFWLATQIDQLLADDVIR